MQLKDNYEKFTKLIFILLPIFLITGPFLPGLAVVLISFYSLINLQHEIFKKIIQDNVFKIILLFCFIIILSSLFSNDVFYSLKSSIFYIRFLLFSVGLSILLLKFPNLIKIFLYIGIVTLLVLFLDSIYQFIYGYNIIGLEKHSNRISSFFGEELILGSYVYKLVGIYLVCFILIQNEIKYKNVFLISLMSIAGILIYFSAERVSIFSFIVLVSFIFILFKNLRKTLFLTFLIIILISFLSFYIDPNYYVRIFLNTYYDILGEYFMREHIVLLRKTILMFINNPFLGVGPNMFRIECLDEIYKIGINDYCTTHPHSIYFQILGETGLLGITPLIVIFLILNYSILKYFLKKNKKNEINLKISTFLIIVIMINLIPLIPSGNFFGSYINIYYYLPLGFYLYSKYEKSQN